MMSDLTKSLDQTSRSQCEIRLPPPLPSQSFDHQAALHELNSLLREFSHKDRTMIRSKTQEQLVKITVKIKESSRLNRCSLLTISGRISRRLKRRRYPPKGTWVVAALISAEDGRILQGWGRVKRRGRFSFDTQVPADINPGAYDVLVYFPTQEGWEASWSEIE